MLFVAFSVVKVYFLLLFPSLELISFFRFQTRLLFICIKAVCVTRRQACSHSREAKEEETTPFHYFFFVIRCTCFSWFQFLFNQPLRCINVWMNKEDFVAHSILLSSYHTRTHPSTMYDLYLFINIFHIFSWTENTRMRKFSVFQNNWNSVCHPTDPTNSLCSAAVRDILIEWNWYFGSRYRESNTYRQQKIDCMLSDVWDHTQISPFTQWISDGYCFFFAIWEMAKCFLHSQSLPIISTYLLK